MIPNWRTILLSTGLVSVLLTACPYQPPPSAPALGAMVRLVPVAGDLERPLYATSPAGDASALFVVEQAGRIHVFRDGVRQGPPFLDITERVGSIQGERGLLGLAFHPDYADNGAFFVNYTNTEGNNVIARFQRSADDPDHADPDSIDVVLTIDQPYSTHNSGMLAFGPDGYLYIGSGDGGSAYDPMNNGQSLDTLLGKILRVDVNSPNDYRVPVGNPLVDMPGARDEIWAYGLRNPWRFSFDRETGDLWIADVGQFAYEEINFQAADSPGGTNYGWRLREGYLCGVGESDCERPDLVDPLHAYYNIGSQSITGGYVYRGDAVPALQGTYFFGDYITGSIYALQRSGNGAVTVTDETPVLERDGVDLLSVASFGEDGNGELYIVDYGAGVVYAMVPA